MTYISWSSDFALYLEDYLVYESYFGILSQYGTTFYEFCRAVDLYYELVVTMTTKGNRLLSMYRSNSSRHCRQTNMQTAIKS